MIPSDYWTSRQDKIPLFAKQVARAGSEAGHKDSYVNITDIAQIYRVENNLWEAQAKTGKNIYGGPATYHFDDKEAQKIIHYIA